MKKLVSIYPLPNYTDPNPAVLNNYLALVTECGRQGFPESQGRYESAAERYADGALHQAMVQQGSQWIHTRQLDRRTRHFERNQRRDDGDTRFFAQPGNEARAGWNYIVDGNTLLNTTTISELNAIPGAIVSPGYPDISMRNLTRTRAIRALTTLPNPYQVWQSSFQYMDNVSWHKNGHAIKAGVEYTHDRERRAGQQSGRRSQVFDRRLRHDSHRRRNRARPS